MLLKIPLLLLHMFLKLDRMEQLVIYASESLNEAAEKRSEAIETGGGASS
jgi:hypothetical protein